MVVDDAEFDELRTQFLASPWANRVPIEIEVPFATRIAGVGVRGRIDAVFADSDGGLTVVDWKTGRPPAQARRAALGVQLACYRLAIAELRGVPLSAVRAAFHYIPTGVTVAPVDLLDAHGIGEMIATAVGHGQPRRAVIAAGTPRRPLPRLAARAAPIRRPHPPRTGRLTIARQDRPARLSAPVTAARRGLRW